MSDRLKDIENRVILSDTDPSKLPMLTLYSTNVELIEKFKHLGYANLPKDLGWFHQSNCRTFQMFEFWKPQEPAMTDIGQLIANALNLEFVVNLQKAYESTKVIELGEFKPFDEQFHTFNEFFGQ